MITSIGVLALTAALGLALQMLGRTRAETDLLIGTSFQIGSILIILSMLMLDLFDIRWSPIAILVLAIPLVGLGRTLRILEEGVPSPRAARPEFAIPDILIVTTVVLHAVYVTAAAPLDLDYLAIWGLKAKINFVAGGRIDWSFLRDATNEFAHPDYPPLLTLQYGWLASWKEHWDDRWFGLLETAMLGSLLLVIRAHIRSLTGSVQIGSWTAALVALPAIPTRFGIADVPLFTFVTSGLLYLERGWRKDEQRSLTWGFVLLGGAALTKNEGLSWLVLSIVVCMFFARRTRRTFLLALPGVVLALSWQIPRLIAGLSPDVAAAGAVSRIIGRLADAGWMMNLIHLAPAELTAAMIALIIALFVAPGRLREFRLLFSVVSAQFVVYLGVYLMTPYPVDWHVATSWDRISIHLAIPVLVVTIAALVGRAGMPVNSPATGS